MKSHNLWTSILERIGKKHAWLVVIVAALTIIALGNVADAAVPASIPTGVETQKADPSDPFGIADFNCADIDRYGIEKQMNFRAAAILDKCRGKSQKAEAPSGPTGIAALDKVMAPLAFGGTDINLITGAETSPRVTQSTSYIWANGNKILVAYNDSRGTNQSPPNYTGASVSTDGGATFTRLTLTNGQSPFSNAIVPVVLYHAPSATWHTVWLSLGGTCGGGARGLARFEAPDATMHDPAAWAFDGCVHTGSSDDQPKGWVDNNQSSPFYGRMYVSWNDFSIGGGVIRVAHSTDGGTTWSAPVNVTTNFIRNVQITGDAGGGGTLYIAGMDEMGGGLGNRANKMYRSTDGGVTWTNTYTGPTFPGPGRSISGYFATMYSAPSYWRYMGWGQPGALGNVVHYVYASRDPATGDAGNVFYVRSTDMGVTFSTPVRMNTDVGTRAQWFPSLSVGQSGGVFVGWYDERESASCTYGNPAVPCYRRFGRASIDNGLTWQPDDMVGDVASPLPAQPDHRFNSTSAGDGDHAFAQGDRHYQAWTDGRVAIGGQSQQDVAFSVIDICASSVGPWTPVAPYIMTVRSPAIATDGTYLYSMGGLDGFTVRNIVQLYDPTTNTWQARANLPIALEAARAAYAAVNNKIYVFGGYNASGNVLNTVYIYDIASNSWSSGANMPAPRRYPNVAYYSGNNKIYVIGGHAVGPEQNQTWEYNPVANTWASRANIPVAMGSSATSIVGQHIYLMGSEGGGGGTTLHYRYDILSNTWATRAALPAPTFRAAAGAVGSNTIVLFGGGTNITPYNASHIYDIASDSWTAGPSMTTAHSYTGGTAVGNRVFAVGGWSGSGYTNVVERANVATPCITPTPTPTITITPTPTRTPTASATPTVPPQVICSWKSVAPYRIPIDRSAVTTDGTYVYSIGGETSNNAPTDLVQRYDPSSDTWTMLASLPMEISHVHATYAAVTDQIYAFGGMDAHSNSLDTLYVYDIASDKWSTGTNMPAPRESASVAYYDSYQKIYVIGGLEAFVEQGQTWEYDPVTDTWDTSRANIPDVMGGSAVSIIGQYIYLMGSEGGGRATTLHYRYDIVSDTWDTRAHLPAPTFYGAAGAVGNAIALFGGLDDSSPPMPYDTSYLYDTATDSWTSGPTMKVAHGASGGTAVRDLLIVVGGVDRFGNPLEDIEIALVTTGACPASINASKPTVVPTVPNAEYAP